MVFTVKDNNAILPASNSSTLNYDFDVDWDNDGIFDDTAQTSVIGHTYANYGIHTIRVRGIYPRIDIVHSNNVQSFDQFGDIVYIGLINAFASDSVRLVATDTPHFENGSSFRYAFSGNKVFNSNINHWDVSMIVDMSFMFQSAWSFNQNLNNWNTSRVKDMSNMFEDATLFNGNISNWSTDSVTDMSDMFLLTQNFNQNINNWNVGQVTNMESMFEASVFNSPLSNWNTSSVTNMKDMFSGAFMFDQDLSNWDITNVGNFQGFVDGIPSTFGSPSFGSSNYDNLLNSWANKAHQNNVNFGAMGLSYCQGQLGRDSLINDGWTFVGDTRTSSCTVGIEEIENSKDELTIYPNPSNGIVHLNIKNERSNTIARIYNSYGQVVMEQNMINGTNLLDLNHLEAGSYILECEGKREKVLIQH